MPRRTLFLVLFSLYLLLSFFIVQSAVRIHQLLTVPGWEPVIPCQNGSVDFLSNYKELPDNGPVKENEEIVWCSAAKAGEELVVAMITNSKVILSKLIT